MTATDPHDRRWIALGTLAALAITVLAGYLARSRALRAELESDWLDEGSGCVDHDPSAAARMVSAGLRKEQER